MILGYTGEFFEQKKKEKNPWSRFSAKSKKVPKMAKIGQKCRF